MKNVASIQRTHLKQSLREALGIELEWYYFLHNINTRKTTRKTDIISINLLFEPTTGIDILNRMIRAGLLSEEVDPADRRARLLTITKEGKKILQQAERLAQETADLLFGDIPDTKQAQIEQYLKAIEARITPLLTPKP
ncbi:MAG: winged helix DNA-binding protein [Bacteroidetes bacterium]|nr:winged helix DNA-binding protein [Bacteroidota bacterium]